MRKSRAGNRGKCIALILFFFFCVFSAFSQITVTGNVTEDSGIALPGVNIVLKGSTTGTATDFDGNYTIEVPDENAILVFSFLGFQEKEVQVGNKQTLNVTLQTDTAQLDEVVVVGYGTVKKSDLTGATTRVTAKDFNQGVVVSPQDLLTGKAAGVSITSNSGQPGANATVRIRGTNSVNGDSDPLYVVDGVPLAFDDGGFINGAGNNSADRFNLARNNPLNMINPADIEAIDVLKGASATAIYGSRASNGVIIITTKSGTKGLFTVNYNGFTSISNIRRKLDVLTGDEYRAFAEERGITLEPRTEFGSINDPGQDGGFNTDWQDEIFRTAYTQSHTVSFNGGNSGLNFRGSVGYLDQEGIIINSGLEKLNSNVNINSNFLEDKLRASFSIINSNERSKGTPLVSGVAGGASGDVIYDALLANPTFPARTPGGGFTAISRFRQNPVEEALLLENVSEVDRTISNLKLNLDVTEELELGVLVGSTFDSGSLKLFTPLASRLGSEGAAFASIQNYKNTSQLLELTALYKTTLFNNHKVKLLGGYSWQTFENEGTFIRRSGVTSDFLKFNNIESQSVINPGGALSSKGRNRIISFFGRLNYDIANKYLFTATLRRDGSSRFSEENKWGYFPSFAAAWKLSEESFLENSNTISTLKLRAEYGETGNERVPNFVSQEVFGVSTAVFPEIGGFARPVGNFPNPNIKWETTKAYNIGIDFGILNERFTGSLEYYHKTTTDLLIRNKLPERFVAVSDIFINLGDVENKGFEFNFNASVISSGDFDLDLYGNISKNENEIVSLTSDIIQIPRDGLPTVGEASLFKGGQIIRQKEGEPINSYFGLKFKGFDANGVEQFEDLNGDSVIDEADRTFLGDNNPDYVYGFGFKLDYKRLTLNAAFRGVEGVELYNALRVGLEDGSNFPESNVLAAVPEFNLGGASQNIASDRVVEDASFLRLDNVTLSYNVNVERIPVISGLQLNVTGQNLFVLTDYTGYDPEVNVQDFTTYPRARTFIVGMNVQF